MLSWYCPPVGDGLATDIVDWRRFERPTQLACYLGLVSREDSSGDRTRLGSITKAGNTHCRHVLVQAAWSYRHRPQTSVDLKHRPQGQPPAVITHAWKAQHRLHQRFVYLNDRKRPQIAVVAVARARRLFVGGDAGSRNTIRGVIAVVVVRRVASRLDVRARSMALCGPCRLQQRTPRV